MKIDREYPRTARLGAASVELRLMSGADREAVWALGRSLSERDLLVLRGDLSRAEVLDEWIDALGRGELVTVLAEEHGAVAGFATIEPETDPWSRHVAELRMAVAPALRGRGLGRLLTQEAFAIALSAGIEKITGRLLPDQSAALRAYQGLGFRPEGMFREYLKDPEGRKHDLLVLSHDVAAFHAMLEAYGLPEAFEPQP